MKFKQVKKYIKQEIKFLKDRIKFAQKEYAKANIQKNRMLTIKADIEREIRILETALKILEKKTRE